MERTRNVGEVSLLIWLGFGAVLAVVVIILNKLLFTIANSLAEHSLLIFGVLWGSAMTYALIKGLTTVAVKYEVIVEILGMPINTLSSGIYLLFPFFGITKIKAKVFMGQQIMQLFMNNDIKDGYGFGHIDFKDGTAPALCTVYFTIINARKAIYNIAQLYRGIEEKMDDAVRAFLSMFTIDEASEKSGQFNLPSILSGQLKTVDDKTYQRAPIFLTILQNWGVRIDNISISDIVLPPGVVTVREKLLVATRDVEVAKAEVKAGKKRLELTQAQGAAEGKKHAEMVQTVANIPGMNSVLASAYLENMYRWQQVGDKAVIFSDSQGVGTDAARIAAIIQATNAAVKPPSATTTTTGAK